MGCEAVPVGVRVESEGLRLREGEGVIDGVEDADSEWSAETVGVDEAVGDPLGLQLEPCDCVPVGVTEAVGVRAADGGRVTVGPVAEAVGLPESVGVRDCEALAERDAAADGVQEWDSEAAQERVGDPVRDADVPVPDAVRLRDTVRSAERDRDTLAEKLAEKVLLRERLLVRPLVGDVVGEGGDGLVLRLCVAQWEGRGVCVAVHVVDGVAEEVWDVAEALRDAEGLGGRLRVRLRDGVRRVRVPDAVGDADGVADRVPEPLPPRVRDAAEPVQDVSEPVGVHVGLGEPVDEAGDLLGLRDGEAVEQLRVHVGVPVADADAEGQRDSVRLRDGLPVGLVVPEREWESVGVPEGNGVGGVGVRLAVELRLGLGLPGLIVGDAGVGVRDAETVDAVRLGLAPLRDAEEAEAVATEREREAVEGVGVPLGERWRVAVGGLGVPLPVPVPVHDHVAVGGVRVRVRDHRGDRVRVPESVGDGPVGVRDAVREDGVPVRVTLHEGLRVGVGVAVVRLQDARVSDGEREVGVRVPAVQETEYVRVWEGVRVGGVAEGLRRAEPVGVAERVLLHERDAVEPALGTCDEEVVRVRVRETDGLAGGEPVAEADHDGLRLAVGVPVRLLLRLREARLELKVPLAVADSDSDRASAAVPVAVQVPLPLPEADGDRERLLEADAEADAVALGVREAKAVREGLAVLLPVPVPVAVAVLIAVAEDEADSDFEAVRVSVWVPEAERREGVGVHTREPEPESVPVPVGSSDGEQEALAVAVGAVRERSAVAEAVLLRLHDVVRVAVVDAEGLMVGLREAVGAQDPLPVRVAVSVRRSLALPLKVQDRDREAVGRPLPIWLRLRVRVGVWERLGRLPLQVSELSVREREAESVRARLALPLLLRDSGDRVREQVPLAVSPVAVPVERLAVALGLHDRAWLWVPLRVGDRDAVGLAIAVAVERLGVRVLGGDSVAVPETLGVDLDGLQVGDGDQV